MGWTGYKLFKYELGILHDALLTTLINTVIIAKEVFLHQLRQRVPLLHHE